MNRGTLLRFALFFTAVPLIGMSILFLPYYKYLSLNLFTIIATIICSIEMADIFSVTGSRVNRVFAGIIGGLISTSAYLEVLSVLPAGTMNVMIFLIVIFILARPVFFEKNLRNEQNRSSLSLVAIIVYPGLLLTSIIRMASLPDPRAAYITLTMIVFMNDSMAWLVGVLSGKRGIRNLIPVSPNKSLQGFIAGFLTSVLFAWLSSLFFPNLYGNAPLWKILCLGSILGFLTILGDLAESALKRSADVKDSGTIIPGRGGFLDSADSMLFTAPAFYFAMTLFFG